MITSFKIKTIIAFGRIVHLDCILFYGQRDLFVQEYAQISVYSIFKTLDMETIARIPGSSRRTFIVLFWSKHSSKESNAMSGPGTYRPDPTEGITALAELS